MLERDIVQKGKFPKVSFPGSSVTSCITPVFPNFPQWCSNARYFFKSFKIVFFSWGGGGGREEGDRLNYHVQRTITCEIADHCVSSNTGSLPGLPCRWISDWNHNINKLRKHRSLWPTISLLELPCLLILKSVLRTRIQDPVLFCPLDPGWEKIRILDSGYCTE